MSGDLQIVVLPGETRAFLWRDGRLEGFALLRDDLGLAPGDRVAGRVLRLDRRLQGAFVALPEGPDGLLPLNAVPGLSEGQALALRVVRAAAETKGPLLAPLAEPLPPGPVPRLLARGQGALAALLPQAEVIACDDPALTATLKAEDWPVRYRAYDQGQSDLQMAALLSLLRPEVPLDCGANLLIESGRTLTALDVNLGRAADAAAANRAALPEIARQLRLRDLGGRLVIDFLEDPDRVVLERELKTACRSDPARIVFTGWSRGGLYELTRRRSGRAPAALLLEPDGFAGWRLTPRVRALQALAALDLAQRGSGRRRRLLVPDALLPFLSGPAVADWFTARHGRPPEIQGAPLEDYRIEELAG